MNDVYRVSVVVEPAPEGAKPVQVGDGWLLHSCKKPGLWSVLSHRVVTGQCWECRECHRRWVWSWGSWSWWG